MQPHSAKVNKWSSLHIKGMQPYLYFDFRLRASRIVEKYLPNSEAVTCSDRLMKQPQEINAEGIEEVLCLVCLMSAPQSSSLLPSSAPAS